MLAAHEGRSGSKFETQIFNYPKLEVFNLSEEFERRRITDWFLALGVMLGTTSGFARFRLDAMFLSGLPVELGRGSIQRQALCFFLELFACGACSVLVSEFATEILES